jgi:hypothetical protein
MGTPWRLEGEWARKEREAYTPCGLLDARILVLGAPVSPQRTNDNSPPIYRWVKAKTKIAVRAADD